MSHPIPNAALDDRLAIVGTSGSGKTYGAGTAVERLLSTKARVLIVDPLGVWWGLGLAADGKRPSVFRQNEKLVIFGGAHGDMQLLPASGGLMGETIAGMSESCILDLSEMGTDAEQRRFMLALLASLFKHKVRDLLHVVFDEADMWAPQLILDKDGESPKLLGQMQKIVKRGRVFGFIPWLITQNPAGIAKSVLGQVNGMIAFSLTSSQDRDAIGAWVKGQADVEQWKDIWGKMPELETGHALTWLPRRKVFKFDQFPAKVTFDSSRAPKRGERVKAKKLKPINLDKLQERLASVEAEIKANDPKALKSEVMKLRQENAMLENKIAHAPTPKPATDRKAIADAEKRGFEQAKKKLAVASEKAARSQLKKFFEELRQKLKPLDAFFAAAEKDARSQKLEAISFTPPVAIPAPSRSMLDTARAAAKDIGKVTTIRPAQLGAAPVGDLSPTQVAILNGIAWAEVLGSPQVSRTMVAFLAGSSPKSSTFEKYVSQLRTGGLLDVPRGGFLELTDAGRKIAVAPDAPPDHASIMTLVEKKTTPGQMAIVKAAASAYPEALSREDLAARAGQSPTSSTFEKYVSQMKSLGLLDQPAPKMLVASDQLFPSRAAA